LGGVAGSVVGNTIGSVIDRINGSINYGSSAKQPDAAAEQVKRMLVRDPAGAYNPEVVLMQERLNALGYRDQYGRRLVEDGRFGKSTEAAVNLFKDENALWNYGE
ncbi:peptidoglycan-binding domain-containing protein, partial [Stenotrophomonas maltophilia group sp. RNC7]|uniref:peptidoglycan-binding domain-containing protein n=1 Tax=Stenotrophomonas maltophilia group sp. RNC7 TaxID=3071467 RepID=UPI0027E1E01F